MFRVEDFVDKAVGQGKRSVDVSVNRTRIRHDNSFAPLNILVEESHIDIWHYYLKVKAGEMEKSLYMGMSAILDKTLYSGDAVKLAKRIKHYAEGKKYELDVRVDGIGLVSI